MKKPLLLLLSFFYLLTASGINVNLHYCGGKLKKISFFSSCENESCCCKKAKKKNCNAGKSCCKSKVVVVKVKDNHNYSPDLKAPSNTFKFVSNKFPQLTLNFAANFFKELTPDSHAPPDLYESPKYLQHRVLII